MFGFSYGEVLLLLGATAALIGPKDLPIVARTAGRLFGRAIGYIQLARGQLDTVMHKSEVHQMQMEVQKLHAQFQALSYQLPTRHSILNPGSFNPRLVDDAGNTSNSNVNGDVPPSLDANNIQKSFVSNPFVTPASAASVQTTTISKTSDSCNVHRQATAYARLAESSALEVGLMKHGEDVGIPNVLPLSAESTGMLPNRPDDMQGSDIVLEAILEAEVAQKAKDFFAQPENQIKQE